jgi:hypothetical protein
MIDLKQEAIKIETSRWERFKLKHDFRYMPDYACVSINDFLQNRTEVGLNKDVIFPSLTYLALNRDERENLGVEVVPITLKDPTGKIEVFVRPMAHNIYGRFIVPDKLHEMWAGGTLFYPILKNGTFWPGDSEPDTRIYLRGFEYHGPAKEQKNLASVLSGILEKLLPEANLQPVPVRG